MEFSINYWILPLAALVPMILGFVWYHEKTFGKAWMKVADMTEEKIQSGNMAVTFGLSYVFSLFLAATLLGICMHQQAVLQLFAGIEGFGQAGNEATTYFNEFMAKYGDMHRSFGHGALHGSIAGVMFAFPIIATNALFEKKGWKYIWINGGYWVVCCTIMGAIISQFA